MLFLKIIKRLIAIATLFCQKLMFIDIKVFFPMKKVVFDRAE